MIRTALRVVAAVPLVAVGFGAASAVARVGPAAPLCAQAADTHRLGVVVEHGNAQAIRRCVGFNTPTITALAALQATGLETATESYGSLGTAVCQIDHEPAQYTTCLPVSGSYWVLFTSHGGGAWSNSALGASNTTVASGDDIGFRYDPQAGADPPPPSPAGTCPSTPPTTSSPEPSTRQSAAPHSTPAVRATPSASTVVPVTTPTAGVLGVSSPAASEAPVGSLSHGSAQPPSLNVGLLLGAIAAGCLIGLLGVQGVRRRRS